MEHRMVQETLWMLDDPELAKADRQAILSHLDQCVECAQLVQQWRRVQGMVARVSPPAPSEAFVEGVMDRVLLPPAPGLSPARSRWVIPWWVAPQLGIGLAGVLFALLFVQPQPMIATETLLLAGSPDGAEWEFSSQAPDAQLLLNTSAEEAP